MKDISKKIAFALALACVSIFPIQAQIVINEFSCANKSVVADNFGEYNDWVELYNAGVSPVDLTGYYLSDNRNTPTKWMIPSGILNPGAYRFFFASDRDTIVGNFSHTNFKLKQTAHEEVVLANNIGVIIDSISITPTQ